MNSKVIIFLDLETTGLEPSIDEILEIGIIITDWDLNELNRGNWILEYHLMKEYLDPILNHIIQVDPTLNHTIPPEWSNIIPTNSIPNLKNGKKLHPTVQKMHTDNGLFEECNKSTLSLSDAEVQVMRFLEGYLEKGSHFVMAGNSIHFDKVFIEHKMKLLSTLFHYRVIDVSNFIIVAEKWTPNRFEAVRKELHKKSEEKKVRAHRCIDDIEKCINQLKLFKSNLFIDS